MNTTIDELAREKKERDFLDEINQGSPDYFKYTSLDDVLSNHDCKTRQGGGCSTCMLLMNYGFISDYVPDPEDEVSDEDWLDQQSIRMYDKYGQ